VPDPVRSDAQRDDVRFLSYRLVGVPPGQLPPPLLTCQAARNGHIAGLMRDQEGSERVRPAERRVDACFVRGHQRSLDRLVVSADAEVLDDRFAVDPLKNCHGRPNRLGRQIHPYHSHQQRLRRSS